MVPEDGDSFRDEGFEDALVEEGAVHGLRVVAREQAVAEGGEEVEGLGFGEVAREGGEDLAWVVPTRVWSGNGGIVKGSVAEEMK